MINGQPQEQRTCSTKRNMLEEAKSRGSRGDRCMTSLAAFRALISASVSTRSTMNMLEKLICRTGESGGKEKDACGEEGGRSDENPHALSVNGRVWFISTLWGGGGRRWPSTNVVTSAETQQRRRLKRQRLYWHENKQPCTCTIHASIRTHFSLSRYLSA